MAPSFSIQFIETALFCTTPFALSYADPNQKWLIRKHLLKLLQNYPDFNLSNDTFIHNDGTTVNLLNVSGYLNVSESSPSIHLTIWLHEDYPSMAPMVFITSNSINPIRQNHPFVTPCGVIITPYLQTWSYPGCNLSDLVHNLVKIFSCDHPFSYSSESSFTHPSLASKREAVDRLSGMLHYDVAAFQAKTSEEIEELSVVQDEMKERAGVIRNIGSELEHERKRLKERATELAEKADVLMNWLKVNNDPKAIGVILGDEIEEAFEATDEKSKVMLYGLAADEAIEDAIYALDKALVQGVVSFDIYIRQVRILAREQFFCRVQHPQIDEGSGYTH
ncbi:protein ELC-like [Melia azedarach]|uniref:Protein ELC-like n=1 Tax=Melia azedarach TaxID=155640 RepID=A0ACC1YVM3_MELAZ|nr:protein ELC-like [Melia azedarach]